VSHEEKALIRGLALNLKSPISSALRRYLLDDTGDHVA
jgi:hypothetical protein